MKVIASLDSRETLQSEPIEFKNETPEFNTELVWTMNRLTFQALRSRKALLKLQIVENDTNDIAGSSEKNIGSFLFDLKEAIPSPKPPDNPDESYIVHAAWRKLKVNDLPAPGRDAPSIRAALVIEPNDTSEKEDQNKDQDDDKTMIDEDLATQFVDDQHIVSKYKIVYNEEWAF